MNVEQRHLIYKQTNGMAIASFVLSFFFWPLGIVFGHIARRQIRRTGQDGGGLALAGLIISYVWAGLVIVLIIVAVAAAEHSGCVANGTC